MSTFALIHGGGHGGWCWDLLVPELEARGHAGVGPDMPAEDPTAGAREYAQVMVEALDGIDDDVVVVGHSLGGMIVPVVAAMRPVRHMVFLGSMVPAPGEVYEHFITAQADGLTAAPDRAAYDADDVHPARSEAAAMHAYYHDVEPELARRACARLRPQSRRPFTEACPLTAWPDVPSTYILMTEDRSVGQDFSRRLARERLGVEPLELPGSHSPFLSRPAALADVLAGL